MKFMNTKIILFCASLFAVQFVSSEVAQAQNSPMSVAHTVTKTEYDNAVTTFKNAGISMANFSPLEIVMQYALSNSKRNYANIKSNSESTPEAITNAFNKLRHQMTVYNEIRERLVAGNANEEFINIKLDEFGTTLQ